MVLTDDVNREGFRWIKLWQFFRVLSPGSKRVLTRLQKVSGIDMKTLESMTGKKYKGIIFDFDETLAPNYGQILDENFELIRELLISGLKVTIFSNMKESDRYDELKKLGVKVHKTVYPKPHAKGFLECCEMMGLNVGDVLMVGDNLMTDGGAMNVGIDFILVEPVPTKEKFRMNRLVQKTLRRITNVNVKTRAKL